MFRRFSVLDAFSAYDIFNLRWVYWAVTPSWVKETLCRVLPSFSSLSPALPVAFVFLLLRHSKAPAQIPHPSGDRVLSWCSALTMSLSLVHAGSHLCGGVISIGLECAHLSRCPHLSHLSQCLEDRNHPVFAEWRIRPFSSFERQRRSLIFMK